MKQVRPALGGLLAVCVVVRVGAWLIAPAWPLIVTLLVLLGILRLITGRPYGGL